jgi:hypothetical protein
LKSNDERAGEPSIGFEVRDYRGCERASLVCNPIALLAGRNGQGKTSIAQALAAVLAGKPIPLPGVTKAAAGKLVRTGAKAAFVTANSAGGTARIDWPACMVRASGPAPPAASDYAAGVENIVAASPSERARVLGSYLHSQPDRVDLSAAMADLGFRAEAIDAIWQLVEESGWDAAHSARRDRGVELKARWREVTGAVYGSRVGASWRPDLADDEANENDLIAAVVRAKHAHETAIGAAAVSTAERERLATAAGKLDAATDALRGAEERADALAAQLDQATLARAALPDATGRAGLPCPHCGAFVLIEQVNLVERRLVTAPAATMAPADLKKVRLAVAEADGTINRLKAALVTADQAVETARHELQNSAEAANYLNALPPATSAPGEAETAKAALDRAEDKLTGWRKKREADDLHRRIASNEAVLDLLAPDGLRARKLARVLDLFNATLRGRSEAAGWGVVSVEADGMALVYDGRAYALLSTSEQYRVRAVLQIVMAEMDGSAMVVIDAADVLDAPTRSGLFALLGAAGLPALVAMTLSRREQVPDLAPAGLGASYWIEAGIVEALL